jgi:acyl carrier protein
LPGPTAPEGVDAADARTEEVLGVVRTIIADVIGDDYMQQIEIDMDTSFQDDIELESIEFVALGEKLTERYGERVDFVGWLGTMDVDEIMGMTVGRLVVHIASCDG